MAAPAINGIAARVVQVRRVAEEEGLAEVAEVLATSPKAQHQPVLDMAITPYLRPGSGRPEVWYAAAAAFLVRAGARPNSNVDDEPA